MMSQLVPLFAHTVGLQDVAWPLAWPRFDFSLINLLYVLARSRLDLDSARPTLARPCERCLERCHQKWD